MQGTRAQGLRVELDGSAATTVHLVRHPLRQTMVRIVSVSPAESLAVWCARLGVIEAISGGFMVKPDGVPLGYLRSGGRNREHRPFKAPWDKKRGCVATTEVGVAICARDEIDAPADVFQAGPLLVRDGRRVLAADDPEGFSTTSEEFDQDITDGREPRAAIALAEDALIALVADGRTDHDAGLTLWELADVLIDLGADAGLNLDGGSAATLVSAGAVLNTPRDDDGEELEHPSETPSALVFLPRDEAC